MKPGRKSAAESAIIPAELPKNEYSPPDELSPAAKRLWRAIIHVMPDHHFLAGDLPLLREYVHTVCDLIPEVNAKIEAEGIEGKHLSLRTMLTKEAATLATKLRICVSSRTRGDLAELRNNIKAVNSLDFSGLFSNEQGEAWDKHTDGLTPLEDLDSAN
jgi:hypothetical protein